MGIWNQIHREDRCTSGTKSSSTRTPYWISEGRNRVANPADLSSARSCSATWTMSGELLERINSVRPSSVSGTPGAGRADGGRFTGSRDGDRHLISGCALKIDAHYMTRSFAGSQKCSWNNDSPTARQVVEVKLDQSEFVGRAAGCSVYPINEAFCARANTVADNQKKDLTTAAQPVEGVLEILGQPRQRVGGSEVLDVSCNSFVFAQTSPSRIGPAEARLKLQEGQLTDSHSVVERLRDYLANSLGAAPELGLTTTK